MLFVILEPSRGATELSAVALCHSPLSVTALILGKGATCQMRTFRLVPTT